jgi:translation initiation factor IF-2
MMNDIGKNVTEAGPSVPVEITGLDIVPNAGDAMSVVESLEVAREIIAHRQQTHKESNTSTPAISSLDELMKKTGEQQQSKELKIVLKGDVQGSVEALKGALTQLSTPDVRVNIVYGGVGGIKESDIMLASASQGLVIGFAVRPDANARQMAERNGVDIRVYQIIYEAVDDVRRAMEGLLGTESREKVLGRAQVREIFKVSKVGTIAGCRVTEGKANRAYRVRVIRDSVQVYEGKVASLKHFKNDVREVESGLECGIGIEAFNDVKAQDVLEFYMIEEIARSLEPNSSDTTPRHVEAKS